MVYGNWLTPYHFQQYYSTADTFPGVLCKILSRIWADESRLFLLAKPEATMRDSLTQHLMGTLRGDVEVRPEQVVDETRPVDIKVTWFCVNRLSLIEIKWLGDSKNKDGSVATRYRDARAKKGAKQLAEYLDANRAHAPAHVTRGILVVLDARRRGLKKNIVLITPEDGMAFADEEIDYNPAYHNIRTDFDVPMRMFLEPKCT